MGKLLRLGCILLASPIKTLLIIIVRELYSKHYLEKNQEG